MEPTRAQAEAAILDLLARRDPGKTICPSDAARALSDDFRPLMDRVRGVGRGRGGRGGREGAADGAGGSRSSPNCCYCR